MSEVERLRARIQEMEQELSMLRGPVPASLPTQSPTSIQSGKTPHEHVPLGHQHFAAGPVVVFAWSPKDDWPILEVSPNCKDILGYTQEEMKSSNFTYASIIHPEDAPIVSALYQECLEKKVKTYECEYRARHADGSYLWVRETTFFDRNAKGELVLVRGYIVDRTEQKAIEALRDTAFETLRMILEVANDGWWDLDLETNKIHYSPRWCEMLGVKQEDVQNNLNFFTSRIHPDDVEAARRAHRTAILGTGDSLSIEFRVQHTDGDYRTFRSRALIKRDKNGRAIRIAGTNTDLTELRRIEQSLRIERSVLAFILESVMAGYSDWEVPEQRHYISPSFKSRFGYEDSEIPNSKDGWLMLIHPEDAPRMDTAFAAHFASKGKEPFRIEALYRHKNGSTRWMLFSASTIKWDKNQNPIRIVGCFLDITSQKNAELATKAALTEARNKQALLETAGRMARLGQWSVDLIDKKLTWSDVTYEIHELLPGVDINVEEAINFYAPEYRESVAAQVKKIIETGEHQTIEAEIITRNGRRLWVSSRGGPVYDDDGKLIGLQGIFQDIDDERRMIERLRQSDERFSSLTRYVPGVLFELYMYDDGRMNFTYLSDSVEEQWGFPKEEVLKDAMIVVGRMHEDDVKAYNAEMDRVIKAPGPFFYESRYRHPTKGVRWVREASQTVRINDNCVIWYGYIYDITEEHTAAEEREEIQRHLLESQKLESLAILAGGVAHDFNNMLAAIMGNIDLAMEEAVNASPALHESLNHCAITVRRAADLSRQMLAYSGRGHFVVEPTDLGQFATENARILRASIHRSIDIKMELAEGLPKIMADTGQLQQIILNLITNAAEAIDRNGTIEVKAYLQHFRNEELRKNRSDYDAPPGQYVVLEVNDTGCGMTQETMKRLFDPFFTTKPTGRGLGMSAILGIVKGHHGALFVESVLGKGTNVKVLFPPFKEGQAIRQMTPLQDVVRSFRLSADQKTPSGKITPVRKEVPEEKAESASVLVIDDERGILQFAEAAISRSGFGVYTAESCNQAVDIFQKYHDKIKYVIIDLSMPDKDGIETLTELRKISTKPQFILSSGYGRKSMPEDLAQIGADAFLQKPYRLADLKTMLGK